MSRKEGFDDDGYHTVERSLEAITLAVETLAENLPDAVRSDHPLMTGAVFEDHGTKIADAIDRLSGAADAIAKALDRIADALSSAKLDT
jgi:hypothetical protein